MIDVYKDESLSIKKARSRCRDKLGQRSKYIAVLHYKRMPESIRMMVKAADIPKLIAKHSAVYVVIADKDSYKIHKNDQFYTELKTLNAKNYYDFLKEYNLKEIYEEKIINARRLYLK